MCGIWFLLSKSDLSLNKYYESFMKTKMRGPENSSFNIINRGGIIIGFHRLAINGLQNVSANQPFIYDDEEYTGYMICNGEIYNYKELSEKYNICLKTGSDCEIIYPLYEKIGEKISEELDGEFAIIICKINKKTNDCKLFVLRDQCGIRPLYLSYWDDNIVLSSELKGIPFKNEVGLKIQQFPPRYYGKLDTKIYDKFEMVKYFDVRQIRETIFEREKALEIIRIELIESVKSRMLCDREFACLLSGGLDSSLVSMIASNICKTRGRKLKTFCLGMDENSPDIIWAKKVAEYIGSEHTTIIIPCEKWLEALDEVIYKIESYDITTIRASTGQYLVSKWISENTDIKVLLIGDGSDELTGGYIYTLNAPSIDEFNKEIFTLIENIHIYDVKRSDRGIASNGLEARVPFLRKKFITKYLSIDKNLRKPAEGEMEKQLLRDAFKNLLPDEILYRKKEAFSDGISTQEKSWFKILLEYFDKKTELELEKYDEDYHIIPHTKEAKYYRQKFGEYFGKNIVVAKLIPKYWMPKWVGEEVTDPSARVLKNYSK